MQLRTFLMGLTVVGLVIPSVIGNTSKVLAEDITFTLENKTRVNMTEFYASPSGVKNWENDILGDDVLGSGKATEININDERTTCNYDFQAKFADGDVVEKYNIDICKLGGGSYQFYD
ncbi:MAG: hypothetical protein RLZZ29_1511 [Cyanobacteriota bacterium]|jgi:hypothetical protein